MDKIMESPGIENVFILPAGRLPVNPAELLESKSCRDIIEELKRRFDVVILDSPPVLPVTDAVLLAGRVDGVILAYEAGRTARSALARAKTQIEASGTKILGIVLNHIKAETEMPASQAYYYRYKYEEKPSKKKGSGPFFFVLLLEKNGPDPFLRRLIWIFEFAACFDSPFGRGGFFICCI